MKNKNKGCLFAIVEIIQGLLAPRKREESQQELKEIPQYRRKFLLTKNELYFYKELKKIADKLNLSVLAKIRMADLVEAINNDYKGFAKIKAKHIDFALCNPDNMYVLILIELDDQSHQRQDRSERDEFINEVYKNVGYKLIRVKNTQNLEQIITEALQQNT